MPFSGLFRMAKMKSDSSPPCVMDSDCLELVWDNGQIMTQGQSSKDKKASGSNNFRSLTASKPQDGKDFSNLKMEKFGSTVDYDFPLSAPSPVGLGQDDDLVPWLSYNVDEPLNNDYCSDFLSELSAVTRNDISKLNYFVSSEKRSSFSNIPREDHTNSTADALNMVQENISKSSLHAAELGGLGTSRELPQHTTCRLGNSIAVNSNASSVQHIVGRDSFCSSSLATSSLVGSNSGTKCLKNDGGRPNSHFGFINFSNFSRPGAALRVSPRNPGSGSAPNGPERLGTDAGRSNEQNLGNSHSVKELHPVTEPFSGSGKPDQPSSFHEENTVKADKLLNVAATVMGSRVVTSDQKAGEPAVTSSSVCSGSSVEKASNDPRLGFKRKVQETGDSEGPSDEAEEESVGVRKAAPARAGTKRSRAAEVHNLSERKRRDRINEKMRALQELIPNCNKADKASMLDEAIEYLKTLQLQVQILSMGAGLYMPPAMMFPGGMPMQHLHGAHMPHFSPMGVGMGMGFRMNMFDVNNGMMQVPQFQGPRYPIPGPSNFHGMMGPSLQTFGHPGQAMMPMSVPRAPLVPFSGGPPLSVPMGLNIPGTAGPTNAPNLTPPANSKDVLQSVGTQGMPTNNVGASANQSMDQATNKNAVESPSALGQNQAKAVNNTETPNPVGRSNIAPS